MFDLEKEYNIDRKAEVEGKWIPFPDGAKLLIARKGNDNYTKMMRKLGKKNRGHLQSEDDAAFQTAEDMMKEIAAHTILKDWTGVAMGGQEVPYTPELGFSVFKKHKDFYERVMEFADEMETFRQEEEEAALGNSEAGSSGTSDMERSSQL